MNPVTPVCVHPLSPNSWSYTQRLRENSLLNGNALYVVVACNSRISGSLSYTDPPPEA